MAAKEWVFGIHAVSELLKQHAQDISELLVQQERGDRRIDEVKALADSAGVRMTVLPGAALEKRLHSENRSQSKPGKRSAKLAHQGVAALCELPDRRGTEKDLEALLDGLDEAPFLLVLDEITDPHNLGACLRSADAAGVHAVIVPKDNSAPLNMTVRKVAVGAAERVPLIAVTNLSRTLKLIQERGIWISGAAGEATQTLYEADLAGPLALVMGSEGKGMRRLTREHCDFLLSIPMHGSVSSLNVSVATGVCLYEAVRQRALKASS